MISDLFGHLADAIRLFAREFGGPGLATVAFLDSSLLSLPEVNDALVVFLALQHPEYWWYYAIFTTMGSVAGCFALYLVGRRGGEALLARRFRASQIERALAVYRRWGPFALVIPSMLPPPMPFKIFVLLAGVSGVSARAFLVSVAFGRGLRYLGQAFLTYRYGADARAFLGAHLPAVALGVAIAMTAAGAGLLLWHRARPA